MATKHITGIVHVHGQIRLPLEPGVDERRMDEIVLALEYDYPETPEVETRTAEVRVPLHPDMTIEELLQVVTDDVETALKVGRTGPADHTVTRPASVIDRAKYGPKGA